MKQEKAEKIAWAIMGFFFVFMGTCQYVYIEKMGYIANGITIMILGIIVLTFPIMQTSIETDKKLYEHLKEHEKSEYKPLFPKIKKDVTNT